MTELTDLFCTLARIPSPSMQEDAVAEQIVSYFQQNHIAVQRDDFGNIYAEIPATGHSYADGVCTVCGELECIYGDVNGDGKISGMDATRLLRYLAFFDPSTGESSLDITAGADTNGDGRINGMDVTRLLRYLAFFDPVTGESKITLGPTA